MTLTEALKKSNYVTRPEINGFLMAKSEDYYEAGFSRIYISSEHGQYSTSNYGIAMDDIMSENWIALTFEVKIEEMP